MATKRKSPVGVKIIACLLMLGSLASLLLPWMKLVADVGRDQTRMSLGELTRNFAGLDAAAVLDSINTELAASGIGVDISALSDLVNRLLDGRFRPHEMGIACRDLSEILWTAQRADLSHTMETLSYGVWGLFGLLALLGLIALICQLTDHRGGMVPYILLGALITGGMLYLRQTANDYLVRESENLLASYGMSSLIQYLGIDLRIVKMGIGAYLNPVLALLAMLLMGIKKKQPEPRYEASPYPARRTEAQQPRPARQTAPESLAEQGRSSAAKTTAAAAPRPNQSTAPRPSQSAAPRPSQSTAPRPVQTAAPAASAAAAIQAGRTPLPGEQSWTCAYCGRKMEADKNFCDLCGSPRPKRQTLAYCPACGSKLRPGSRFCGNCGSSVTAVSGNDETAERE